MDKLIKDIPFIKLNGGGTISPWLSIFLLIWVAYLCLLTISTKNLYFAGALNMAYPRMELR
jgi:hypothetical protein